MCYPRFGINGFIFGVFVFTTEAIPEASSSGAARIALSGIVTQCCFPSPPVCPSVVPAVGCFYTYALHSVQEGNFNGC